MARLHRRPVVPASVPEPLRGLLTAMTADDPAEQVEGNGPGRSTDGGDSGAGDGHPSGDHPYPDHPQQDSQQDHPQPDHPQQDHPGSKAPRADHQPAGGDAGPHGQEKPPEAS